MIGKMRHRVTVIELGETDVGGGVKTPTTTTVDTVWGEVEPVSDREYFYGQQHGHAVTHNVALRDPIVKSNGNEFVPTTRNCRLTYDSRTLKVRGVRRRTERNVGYWVISAVEDVD